MKKTNTNLIILNCIFVTSLIIANIVSSKIVTFWGLTVPAAIVAYPITFLMTDVIGEIFGKKESNITVKIGFFCQLFSLILLSLATLLPVAPFADNQAEFKAVLGSTFRVVFASMIGYLCSQTWDVWVFHKIRDSYIRRHGDTKGGRWIWNNASTISSQIIDTAIFITIAFIGTVPNIFQMILSQYIIKVAYALLDTPFFYLLTRKGLNGKTTQRNTAE